MRAVNPDAMSQMPPMQASPFIRRPPNIPEQARNVWNVVFSRRFKWRAERAVSGGGATPRRSVLGTATAASLWATGAIGTAVGLGSFDVAVTIAALRS
jgi:hypothetical protein